MFHTIVVIEDNPDLQQYLKDLLLESGYWAKIAKDGTSGLNLVKKSQPDLVILDLGLPDVRGETVCQEIRKQYPELPVIILTAKDETSDVIRGLNLGADDYITKPFMGDELLARIKARLRKQGDSKLKVADLELDSNTFEVKRGGSTFFNDYYFGNILYFVGAFLMAIPLVLFEREKPNKEFTKKDMVVISQQT